MPSLWLSLEAGGYVAAFFKRRWFVPLILAGAVVEANVLTKRLQRAERQFKTETRRNGLINFQGEKAVP
jgi:hypothetical protein